MLFLMPNQQCQSTEGSIISKDINKMQDNRGATNVLCQDNNNNNNNDRLTAFDPGQPG